jgi:hypothetical protein
LNIRTLAKFFGETKLAEIDADKISAPISAREYRNGEGELGARRWRRSLNTQADDLAVENHVLGFDDVGFRAFHEGDDFVVFGLGNVERLQRGVNIVVGTSKSRAPAHTGHLCDI